MERGIRLDLMQKLTILADSAKYDAACTSSGAVKRGGKGLGSTVPAGCCHSFSADGRCISLLKVLMSNHCIYDCKYCVNRCSNDIQRTAFTPQELAELTIQFYRRNYIEGLFLSSGVLKNPDFTMEMMIRAIELLRYQYNFWGYVHAKTIPGASPALVDRLGMLADRLSVNIELPSEDSLKRLAPNKTRQAILEPMARIAQGHQSSQMELVRYQDAPRFAPAGQATQMIIGATPDSDYQIIRLASGLYRRYGLRRVFYSAYIPTVEDTLLPALMTQPPLLREHRLYQADFLMRQYRFEAEEILSQGEPNFNPFLDPKCNWAVRNMGYYPVDVNAASLDTLLRVPGIGPTSAGRIVTARRTAKLTLLDLKRLGVVLKRAQYFIRCGDLPLGLRVGKEATVRALIDPGVFSFGSEQMSLLGPGSGQGLALPTPTDVPNVRHAVEEAVTCLAASL